MTKEIRHSHAGYSGDNCNVPTMVCPFSWVEVVKPKGYFSLLFEEKVKSEVQPEPCLLSKCKFFNASEEICKLMDYE